MPAAYPNRPWLKARMLGRLAAGATQAEVCAEPGMPCWGSFRAWAREDAVFAAALANARAQGDWRVRFRFDESIAAAFLARLAEGARMVELFGRPGMPSMATYRYWRATDVGFQEALWRLEQVRRQARGRRMRARYRTFDQAIADRILVRVSRGEPMRRMLETDPGLPCRVVVYRWRCERPDWDRALKIAIRVGRLARERARSQSRCTPEITDEIAYRIVCGASLRSRRRPACRALGRSTMARAPAFARAVHRASDLREDNLNDQMLDIALRHGPYGLAVTKREAAPLQLRVN